MTNARTSRLSGRLRWAGLFGLIAVLSLALTPGVANAQKKKKDTVKVLSYNLYLGSDLADAANAGLASRTDLFADEVGEVLREVNLNDFAVRAQRIAQDIKKRKVDVAGLQEAALWRIEIPSDGGGPPRGTPALVPLIDYIDTLLNELNKKARTKKACGKAAKKRKAQGKKPKPCYRGYRLVVAQQEADVEQPGDFDNDPGSNGKTFDVSSTDSVEDFGRWLDGNDDTPVLNGSPIPGLGSAGGGEPPPPLPTDANFDTSPTGTVPDPGGATDCPDTNPAAGPAFGEDVDPGPGVNPWPFEGYDGDVDPVTPGSQMPVCMLHGIDGDLRLQMRDVIIARKGAGVKTKNVTGGNFTPGSTFSVSVFGGAATLAFTRGWVQADVSVRGKKFRLVNTHLESESFGTIREDQASELVAPGGPAAVPNTVLIGDLNSDPDRAPFDLPDGDGGSNIAINRVLAAGFRPVQPPGPTGGHDELLNDLSVRLGETATPECAATPVACGGRIDHILTNSPSIRFRSGLILDGQIAGLWASDHGGVLSRLKVPGGKKR